MRQENIGQFIAQCRKEQNLTQAQLAQRLAITDRAVSKWETGRSLPDASIMLELCGILHITVQELLSGKRLPQQERNAELEQALNAMHREREHTNRRFLRLEMIIGYMASITFIILIFAAGYATSSRFWQIFLVVLGLVIFLIGVVVALQLERTVGWYLCKRCGQTFIPTKKAMLFSLHYGRTRYFKCPCCHQWSWCKKSSKRTTRKKIDNRSRMHEFSIASLQKRKIYGIIP